MKLLVLTSEPITADQLRRALGDVDPTEAEVMIVAPALQENPLKFWVSDADDAIAKANDVWRQTLEQLRSDGIAASGDSGESDPATAIQDALATFDAARIVIFTHRDEDQRYLEDVDPKELSEHFGRPVEQVALES